MAQTGTATVRKHIVVDAPIDHAFTVFTRRLCSARRSPRPCSSPGPAAT